MFVYDRSEAHDRLLLDWFQQMVAAGELVQTWGTDVGFASFVASLQRDDTVVYLAERDGHAWFVAWVLDGPLKTGFLSCWIAKDRRPTKAALKHFGLVLHCLFTTYTTACCLTVQETVALFLTKVGFTYLGMTQPHGVHVLYYPREKYQELREQLGVDNGG